MNDFSIAYREVHRGSCRAAMRTTVPENRCSRSAEGAMVGLRAPERDSRHEGRTMETAEPASTLPRLLADVVAARGKHDAIVTLRETLSYDELERRTARMARAFL